MQSICVAYEGMEKFFPADKIVMSGNPIREVLSQPASAAQRAEGLEYFGLNPESRHLFIVGGSLGSGTLNRAMQHWIQDGCPEGEGVEVIWQCGKYYKNTIDTFMQAHPEVKGIRLCTSSIFTLVIFLCFVFKCKDTTFFRIITF